MANWYAHINGNNEGPMSEADLRAKVAAGKVTPTHLVWCEGWPQWKPLSQSGLVAPVVPLRKTAAASTAAGPQQTQTGANDLDTGAFGGFWIRVLANMVDNIILFVPNTIIGVVLQLTLGKTEGMIVSMVWNMAAGIAYYVVLQARMEGSLGKKVFGLALVDKNLDPLTSNAAARRYVMLVLGTIPFGAGAIAAGLHPRKQGWHDRFAGSFVVKRSALATARACRTPSDRLASGHADQLGIKRAA
jgi:uncharacterized RDD family membrane protein YckC